MSVHMFRVLIGKGNTSLADLQTRIDDWIDSNPEWSQDTVAHALTERNTQLDATGETYYGVDVRFTQEDTKANLLQKLTDKLKNKVAWYRVGYHTCGHDGSAGACTWSDNVEWTAKDRTIPSGVPTF